MPGTIRNKPAACCCDCDIFATDFPSLDEFFPNADITWVSPGILQVDGGGVAIPLTEHPQYPFASRVWVKVYCISHATLESRPRILLSSNSDGSNAIAVEFRPGDACGELYVIQIEGGVENELHGPVPVPRGVEEQWHNFTACYDPDDRTVKAVFGTEGLSDYTELSYVVPSHTNGKYAGLGNSASGSPVNFDEFDWDRLWYYGDQEEDDPDYYYRDKTYCTPCEGPYCAWAVAHFDNTGNLDCEFEQDTTDWSIDVPTHMETTATSSIILHITEYPWDTREDGSPVVPASHAAGLENNPLSFGPVQYYHWHSLFVAFVADNDGRTVMAIVAAEDTDNYIALKVTVGTGTNQKCGTAKLVSATAGVETDISDEHVIRGLVSGETHYINLEFLDGTVRAQIYQDQNPRYFQILGSPEPTYSPETQTGWTRQLRAFTAANTYHGPHVGVGVDGGSGEVRVSIFRAGCEPVREFCGVEEDYFEWDATSWEKCNWELMSGSWPTRDATDGFLAFTSSAIMRLRNPLTGDAKDDHAASLGLNTGTWPSPGNPDDRVAVIFGGDETFTNYYKAEMFRDDDSTDQLELYRVNSGTPTLLDSGNATVALGVEGCIKDTVLSAITANLTIGASGPGAYGPWCGMEIQPGAGNTIEVVSLLTLRRTGDTLNPWLPTSPSCHKCLGECGTICEGSDFPGEFLVELEDWTSDTTTANCQCSQLNMDVYPEYEGTACVATISLQAWSDTPPIKPRCTGGVTINVKLGTATLPGTLYDTDGNPVTLTGGYWLFVEVRVVYITLSGTPLSVGHWFGYRLGATGDAPFDCTAWSRQQCDYLGRDVGGGDHVCDPLGAAKAYVTSR